MVSEQNDGGSGSTDPGRTKEGWKINGRRLLRFRYRKRRAILRGDPAGFGSTCAARRRHKNRAGCNDREDSEALGSRLERGLGTRRVAKP